MPLLRFFLICPDEIVSMASVIWCLSKIASARVIRQEMLDLIETLTLSSLDLMSTWDEVLMALTEDVEIHIHNDGFQQGVEMFFESLVKRSALVMELANIKGKSEDQANLSATEAKKKTLVEELNRVCDLMASIDANLASAKKELLRV